MNINDIKKYFPNDSAVLESIENEIELSILNNVKYKGFLKIHDSFVYLFSDDVNSTINFNGTTDPMLLLYSEAAKRIRSSSILAKKGYYVDSVSLLRSVYELNKGINAIQNQIINSTKYFGRNRGNDFDSLDDREKERLVNEHIRDIDNLVNNFDDRDIQENLRPSLRTFKRIFHLSVHKSFGNLVLNYKKFISKDGGNLFQPHTDTEIFELYLNSCSFMILMYLKNIKKSGWLSDVNKDKIYWLIDFIEYAYSSMDGYHNDIINYIKMKY